MLIQGIRSVSDAETVAREIVAAVERPFTVRGIRVTVGASVGVTEFPRGPDTYETVLSRADSAMYQAKAKGRGQFQFFGRPETDSPAGSGGDPVRTGGRTSRVE